MRPVLSLVLAAVLGVAVGAGSFWAMVGSFGREITYGPWTTMADIGQVRQSAYTRARVAIYGIWGLPPSEALYFSAITDSQGQPLDHRCSYEVTGTALPARWWSLTAYRDGFFIANPANRYSWSKTDAKPGRDGGWTIRPDPTGAGINGLALGSVEGKILLSLRLYQPYAGIADHRDRVPLPNVRKISC